MHRLPAIILLFMMTLIQLPASSSQVSPFHWTRGIISVKGTAAIYINSKGQPADHLTGRPVSLNQARNMASTRAREKALENLMKALMDLRIEGTMRTRDYIPGDQHLTRRIMDTISTAGKCMVSPGGFNSSVCTINIKMSDLIQVFPYTFPGDELPQPEDRALPTRYSSIIIDARGVGIKPMIFPAILNEDGREIFSRHMISVEHALHHGMMSYVYSESQAENHPLRGEKPFFTVALRGLKGNPVISHRDTRKILSSKETRQALKNCQVIMIIDRP